MGCSNKVANLCPIIQNLTDPPLPTSVRQRIQRISVSIAERYQAQPPKIMDKIVPATFFTMVDLMTFFDEVHAKRFKNALFVSLLNSFELDHK